MAAFDFLEVKNCVYKRVATWGNKFKTMVSI